eukprot:15327368-Ditylum_brightwellii.AAC.2
MHLQCADTIWHVTDGGKEENNGYYRWVLTTDTTRLWEGQGYVQSNLELLESQRTESMNHFYIIVVLYHYCQYHCIHIPNHTTIHYTDNQGIVSKMNWYYMRSIKTQRDCLISDYDVQAQMEDIYDSMELDTPTHCVKGHQDSKDDNSILFWQAQLNICVDLLATDA